MGEFTVYIIKSALSVTLFFLFYKLLLSRETFHKFNRILLLAILVFSFLVPLINISFSNNINYSINAANIDELLYATPSLEPDSASVPRWAIWLINIYLAGVVFSFLLQVVSFIRLLNIIKESRLLANEGGVKLYITTKKVAPFSWMNSFVININDYEIDGEVVAVHEKAHIARKHSYDILISQIALILQWFNPAIYLLKQELQSIHEYEADQAVIFDGVDAKKYQLLLIKKAVGQRVFNLANSFNHRKLKKRITMMVSKKSKKWAAIKALFILPVTAIALMAFASENVSAKTELISKAEISMPFINQVYALQDTIKIKKDSTIVKVIINKPTVKKDVKVKVISKDVQVDTFDIVDDDINNFKEVKVEKILYINSANNKRDTIRLNMTHKGNSKAGVWTIKDSVITITPEGEKNVKLIVIEENEVGDITKGNDVMLIRGAGRIADKDKPLFILNGVKLDEANIKEISPNDIATINVLKGDKAVQMYGKDGEKGVIIITTKDKK